MSAKPYHKPFIKRQVAGQMNKFGSAYQRGFREDIDGVPIDELVRRFGSPVFVLSERALRERYRQVHREFSSRYPNVQFAWSYKTNYLDAVCAAYHQEGSWAEVVSEFEYQKARRLGVPGERIVFNGPMKPREALRTAFDEGAIVNLDHFDEIFTAEEIARELGRTLDVGIRLNMDTGIYPQWTRFGFNLESRAAMDAAKRIAMSEHLRLTGLHSHIGTFMLDSSAYAAQVTKMVGLMREVERDLGCTIERLDFGGGFPSRNRLKGTYLAPELAVPPVEDFVEAIAATLLSVLEPGERPQVIIETGRALIDEAGYLITTVEAARRLPDGTRSYVIDAGVNVLYTSTWYNYKIEVDRPVDGPHENAVVYGPLCMNIDVVHEQAYLPPLARGTRLVLSPMGAYNTTQWMQFIRYRPAIAMVMEAGGAEEVRRAEVLEDIVGPESLPESLREFRL